MPARLASPRARRALLVLLTAAIALAVWVPPRTSAATVWTKNLYHGSGFMTQDPYPTACVAAAAMMMLNFIDLGDTGGNGFRWTATRVKNSSNKSNYRDLASVFWFARAHDTVSAGGRGSDAHGWRNALNYYGWGMNAMRDRNLWVYDDRQYTTFMSAVKAAVRAIAMYDMPVGILGAAGGHAQVMTGYVAVGEDPAVSDDFSVTHIYLSDPLKSRWIRNKKLRIDSFRSGTLRVRFVRYRQTDSPRDDSFTTGWRHSSVAPSRGTSEWYGKYVILQPIRPGLPDVEPAPAPTPTPEPTPPAEPSPSP
jgi:hypothetical protein